MHVKIIKSIIKAIQSNQISLYFLPYLYLTLVLQSRFPLQVNCLKLSVFRSSQAVGTSSSLHWISLTIDFLRHSVKNGIDSFSKFAYLIWKSKQFFLSVCASIRDLFMVSTIDKKSYMCKCVCVCMCSNLFGRWFGVVGCFLAVRKVFTKWIDLLVWLIRINFCRWAYRCCGGNEWSLIS